MAPSHPRPQSRIVVVIAARAAGSLSEGEVARIASAAGGGEVNWLSPGEAAEFPARNPPPAAALRSLLSHPAADVLAVKPRGRRKAVLVADMDSTIVTSETLDELAGEAGIKEKIAEITRRSMNGEIDFAAALRERVAMLEGLDVAALDRTWRRTELMPGARELVATMRAYGAVTALVSGGFTWFTERVAEELGFDHHRANRLIEQNGALTGKVAEPVVDRGAKRVALAEFAEARGVRMAATLAIGDGANDLEMIADAGLGIAYHAKPIVAEASEHRLDHVDLRGALFAQGYRAADFRD